LKNSSQKSFNYLKGKRILINAGPTQENIDPVRFISNHSSGKMGIAIADAAADAGAEVELILGPVQIVPKSKNIKVIRVVSAASMADECISRFKTCNIAILAAAVADFTPETISDKKIKKSDGDLVIRLKPTTDIAAELGRMKRQDQFIAGFALETDNEIENARAKLLRKNMDIIVLNSLKDEGAGFGHDTNRITIIDRYNNIDKFGLKSKDEAARDILGKIISLV
jgi:phosphopantothenoylcysteine decarboxylase / phosphopantothenate---cysteine ligase